MFFFHSVCISRDSAPERKVTVIVRGLRSGPVRKPSAAESIEHRLRRRGIVLRFGDKGRIVTGDARRYDLVRRQCLSSVNHLDQRVEVEREPDGASQRHAIVAHAADIGSAAGKV